MTIARNIEQVDANWSGGSVGSGCVYQGNNGLNATCSYFISPRPDKGTNRNTKARHFLSNGEQLWDFSGNVAERVRFDESDTLVDNLPTDGGSASWRYVEFTNLVGYGDLTYDGIRPSNNAWNSSQGVGQIYTYNTLYADRVITRGGSMGSGGPSSGIFAMSLAAHADEITQFTGFRCAR